MKKAYIVHYVGYDGDSTDPDADPKVMYGLTYDLPEEIHFTKKEAVKEFKKLIKEELENWSDEAITARRQDKASFFIWEEYPERWTEIRIYQVILKE